MYVASWRLNLSGRGSLEAPDGRRLPLERKAAALLAYLALEGPAPRSRVAGLLWSNSPERAARNNLTQVLRHLRHATGAALVQGNGAGDLTLAPDLDDWLAAVRERGLNGRLAEQGFPAPLTRNERSGLSSHHGHVGPCAICCAHVRTARSAPRAE